MRHLYCDGPYLDIAGKGTLIISPFLFFFKSSFRNTRNHQITKRNRAHFPISRQKNVFFFFVYAMIRLDGTHSSEPCISRLDGVKISVLIANLLLVIQAHGERQALPRAVVDCAQKPLGARCPLASRFFPLNRRH